MSCCDNYRVVEIVHVEGWVRCIRYCGGKEGHGLDVENTPARLLFALITETLRLECDSGVSMMAQIAISMAAAHQLRYHSVRASINCPFCTKTPWPVLHPVPNSELILEVE